VAGGWRKPHNAYIIRVIKPRKMNWAGNVARIGEIRNAYKIWSENLKGRDHSEDLGVDGRIILERILRKWYEKVWNVCIWLRLRTIGGLS
jgi:hypothetical protein